MTRRNVPADIAEVLYVSLRHVLDYVGEHGTYPAHMADNMRKILDGFDHQRTEAMGEQHISREATRRYTAMAAFALTNWLEKRAASTQEEQQHFDRWRTELASEDGDIRGDG